MKISNSPHRALTRACFVLLLLFGFLPCMPQAPAVSPEGSWQGTLQAGTTKLRLVLTLSRSSGGDYKAILESLDQGSTIPGDKVALDGEKVRVDFARVSGFYEGVINNDGSEISGTWTQNNHAMPLAFKRAQSAPAAKEDAKPAADEKPFTAPIDVMVPIAPTAFQADGKTHLAYELHVTNMSGQSVALESIQVLSGAGTTLSRVEISDLVANVYTPGNRQASGMGKLSIGGGQMAIVFMWVTLDSCGVSRGCSDRGRSG